MLYLACLRINSFNPEEECCYTSGTLEVDKGACGGTQHGRHGGHAAGCTGARAAGIADAHLHHCWRQPSHPPQLACCEVRSAGETRSLASPNQMGRH